MPARSGRSGGGGSRGGRSGGFRAPRSSGSSSGSKGFRINFGNRSSPSTPSFSGTSGSGADPQNTNPTSYHRPWMRRLGFLNNPLGNIWRTIGIIIALFVFGMCACVALGLIVQQLGLVR